MTDAEELHYLVELVLAASEWRLSEEHLANDMDPLRLEIAQRLERLQGAEIRILKGREQSVVERGLAKAEAKKAKQKDHPNTLRVKFPDGTSHRVPRERCHQEPYPQSPTGYRWVIDDDAVEEMKARYS